MRLHLVLTPVREQKLQRLSLAIAPSKKLQESLWHLRPRLVSSALQEYRKLGDSFVKLAVEDYQGKLFSIWGCMAKAQNTLISQGIGGSSSRKILTHF